MKGLVLAGGKGTRLRPLTYTGAKQLVPLANKPILFYAIEHLVASGVTDLGIVVGETKEQVIEAVGDGSRFGGRVTYIDQPAPLGIAHAVQVSREFLGDAPFVLFLGDNFIKEGIAPYVERFRAGCYNCLVLLCPIDRPQDFGVAELEGERLVHVVEKPQTPPSNLAVIGIYFFDSHVFDAVRRIQPSARGELEITDTIQRLIDDGLDVQAQVIEGRWIDTGRHDDLLEANHLMLEDLEPDLLGSYDEASTIQGRVVLQEGSEVVNSRIQGPAIIGERTRIVNAYVGPFTSIYHDCLIADTEISGSVVLEYTRIEDVGQRIEHSLIGRNVELRGHERRPHGYTLILGDFSKLHMP
ncbi:MAG: glucose-1-phosphate thymidylyltransferase [Chloroflexi bacterium RBG_16_68_14]|nr:MAG: glucose-1-phosphate thymidylyltransferase [Chloroflexi bacterium RBG_16_68_14]